MLVTFNLQLDRDEDLALAADLGGGQKRLRVGLGDGFVHFRARQARDVGNPVSPS